MSKKASERQENVDKTNGKGAKANERAGFKSFAVAPEGKVQQSMYETKWAAYQVWAVCERGDHNYGPVLTDKARQALAEERNHADNNRN
jgi:hypothetical protein